MAYTGRLRPREVLFFQASGVYVEFYEREGKLSFTYSKGPLIKIFEQMHPCNGSIVGPPV